VLFLLRVTLLSLNRELVSTAKLCLFSVFPDIAKIVLRWEILLRFS